MLPLAEVNVEAVSIFAGVVAITLGITYWASKRTKDATTFWAAGRGISGVQNGFAIAGDYMSAASFLGIAGLIFLFGFDGFLYSVGFLVAFVIVLYLLAERMRNSGKFTIADVLSFRLNERPARTAAALGTLTVVAFYLIAQMVGAGILIQALVGINFNVAVLATGAFMLTYVVFGGMLATTWVQIIKAALLMTATVVLSLFVLGEDRLEPVRHLRPRRGAVRRWRRVPGAGPAVHGADRHDLARSRAAARDRRVAAHPDAVLHRAEREGRAVVGGLGGRPDRRVLRDDHVPRFRRPARSSARPGRRAALTRPATWRRRCSRRRSAVEPGPLAATRSWRSSPRSRSRPSWRSSPGW